MLGSAHLCCQLTGPLLFNKQCGTAAATNAIACQYVSETQGADGRMIMFRHARSLAIDWVCT